MSTATDAAAPPEELGPTAELAALRAELAALRDENALLLLHLHEVQEELEGEHRRLGPAGGSTPATRPGAARLVHIHEEGEHRHLDYSVRLAGAPEGGAAKLHLRLLDHLGRPGLGFLAKRSADPPLSAWQATGKEGGRAFMLLFPADDQGRALLQRLGRSDWQRVNDLARLVLQEVCSEGWMFGSHWQATAARLCRQLADLPPRWRYDALTVTRVDDSAAPELELLFAGVSYANREFDSVQLRWRPAGGASAGPSLRWLRPDSPTALPLGSWPTTASGDLAASMSLPVGREGSARDKRQRWAALTLADRDLLLALLEAVPAAAERTPLDALPPGLTPARLHHEASSLNAEARQLVTALKLRGVARRLLRRDAPKAGEAGR